MEESGGGCGDCNSASALSPRSGAVLAERRSAAMSATQKRVGLLSSSSSESQATCSCCCAQAESRVVLPQPAEAESKVTGVASASSSSESKRGRTTSDLGKRGGVSLVESTKSLGSRSRCAGEEARVEGATALERAWAVSSKRASATCAVCPR